MICAAEITEKLLAKILKFFDAEIQTSVSLKKT